MRLVLFDCDGTIVDSQQAIITGMAQAIREAGLTPPPDATILKSVGLSLEEAIASYLPDIAPALRNDILARYRDIAQEIANREDRGEVLFEGMSELIQTLAQERDTFLGIVTMKSRRGVKRVCQTHGFTEVFQVLKSADDGPGKPNPQLIFDAMAELGVAADQTLMIGDTIYDMAMATNANVLPIGVSWGYNPIEELQNYGAQHIVSTAQELKVLLEQLRVDKA
ncbi:MAG: HAD-IA family hydrolase [Parvibaculales bacterium]